MTFYFLGLNYDIASNDTVQRFQTFLLTVTSDFARQNETPEEIKQFLSKSCNIDPSRMQKYLEYYKQNKVNIQLSHLCIGNYIPHLTDVRWTMDYIVKVKNFDN